MEKINKILAKYTKEDSQSIHETIEELCSKGCYQDYGILADVIEFLFQFENIVKNS